ncbi:MULTISPECIES: GntR family transcriptional regulator [Marinobacter]|uniref:GntR family transcriptional regulator n=1 Tax=Marinobacter TaxID=2742 RepID=UPI001D05C3B2|nr:MULTISPECIES: GntR family transcriptional regulator [Marinobacter]MCG8519915.1 GntR family transcriptional regulator [Pseudomonadales bacterium]MCK7565318.1 GntR family transcriptional regulator [Marinobacter xestospongiae]UDL06093.1 GntR family transcriptional regulator [Marinobacter sp. CA1]
MTEKSPGRRKESMADRVYEALKADIFEFRLIPGDRFSEGDIGGRLQASRTPVREALYRLQREGYVDVLFRSGWQVRPLDFQQVADLYDLRITLERAAVEKLCLLPEPPPTLRTLTAIWNPDHPSERAVGSTVRALDESFHCDLVAAAGNREMTRIHREITERLRIIRRLDFTRDDRIDATYEEHAEILDALRRGEASHAADLLASHIRSSQDAVKEITMERIREAAEYQRQQATAAEE